jgi:hypothetical protein
VEFSTPFPSKAFELAGEVIGTGKTKAARASVEVGGESAKVPR